MRIAGMEAVFRLCLMDSPAVEIASAALGTADALLPAITVLKRVALDDASPGETQEAGLQ